MSDPLPLAAAAVRLRGRPGRPRKERPKPDAPAVRTAAAGGTEPRLLDVDAAATYLAISAWTIRDLEAAGTLHRVRVPLPNGGELRRLLFDRAELDELIARWRDRA